MNTLNLNGIDGLLWTCPDGSRTSFSYDIHNGKLFRVSYFDHRDMVFHTEVFFPNGDRWKCDDGQTWERRGI